MLHGNAACGAFPKRRGDAIDVALQLRRLSADSREQPGVIRQLLLCCIDEIESACFFKTEKDGSGLGTQDITLGHCILNALENRGLIPAQGVMNRVLKADPTTAVARSIKPSERLELDARIPPSLGDDVLPQRVEHSFEDRGGRPRRSPRLRPRQRSLDTASAAAPNLLKEKQPDREGYVIEPSPGLGRAAGGGAAGCVLPSPCLDARR